MMKKWLISGFLTIVAILANSHIASSEQVVVSHKVTQPPLIDGLETEEVWRGAEEVKTTDNTAKIEVTIKSAYDGAAIYFLVSFPDQDESRTHRSWIWNKGKGMYEEGPDREDVFVFKWKLDEKTKDISIYSDEPYETDIWYWKACRTDPVGYADDKINRLTQYGTKDSLEIISKSKRKMHIKRDGDSGVSAYKAEIYVDYEGDVLPRYITRQPESSRADVKAKGVWKDGRWTIEFARALVTGNADDVNFKNLNLSYGFGVSRFEIAGRPAEPASDQPLFGSGDTSEILILKFE